MSTPEIIYLIPGEDIEGYPGMSWCESSAPSDHCDPDDAVKYVRADQVERLQERVAELYSALDNVNERLADGCKLSGDEINDVDAALLNTGCEAFILRKQAEAVHGLILKLGIYCESDPIEIVQEEVERLRNEADQAGGGV